MRAPRIPTVRAFGPTGTSSEKIDPDSGKPRNGTSAIRRNKPIPVTLTIDLPMNMFMMSNRGPQYTTPNREKCNSPTVATRPKKTLQRVVLDHG